MQTYLEMVDELRSRLGVAANSTKFPTTRLQTLIKDSHLWCTALYPFRELTVPKTTTTTGDEYYDYPDEYRSFSIWALYVDGKPYRKKTFQSFYEYKRNYSTTTKRIFSDMARQFFLFPIPAAGLALDIFGQIQATQFAADGDKSIFSLSNDDGNEAIVLRAMGVAKGDQNKISEAVGILTKIFSDQKDNSQFDQPLNTPMFVIPDFFGNGTVWDYASPDDYDDDI